jgi:hypothetical protein
MCVHSVTVYTMFLTVLFGLLVLAVLNVLSVAGVSFYVGYWCFVKSVVPASVVRCVGCSYLVNNIAHRRHKRFQQSDLKFLYVTPLNRAYNISALMDAKCNLLSYGRHHSICYTVYLRLYYSLLQSF